MGNNRETCHYHSLVKVSFLACIHHPKTHCFYKFPAWQVFHPQISKRVEALEHIFSACRQVPNYGLINHSSACTCLCKTSSFLLCDPCRIWGWAWLCLGNIQLALPPVSSAPALATRNSFSFVGTAASSFAGASGEAGSFAQESERAIWFY